MKKRKVILASASPRRKEILSLIFESFDVIPADIDENCISFKDPEKAVRQLAEIKANAIFQKHNHNLVIGADTVVVIKNKVLGKPKSRKDAFEMLKKLSGKKHLVITGVALKCKEFCEVFAEISEVYFSKLTDEEINFYIDTDEPYDKAGSYAIQGYAACFIEKIKGDYLNIVGFPLRKTYSILKSKKII